MIKNSTTVLTLLLSILLSDQSLLAQYEKFDIHAYTPLTGNVGTPSAGSANGSIGDIDWTYEGPVWEPATVANGIFATFANANYHAIPQIDSDALHIWNEGEFNFSRTVYDVYIHLAQSPLAPNMDIIDFGITPQIVSGDIWQEGSRVGATSTNGGMIYLPEVNSKILPVFSPINNGGFCVDMAITGIPFELSIYAKRIMGLYDSGLAPDFNSDFLRNPTTRRNTSNIEAKSLNLQLNTVPEPSSTALLGLGGLALILRRKK